MKTSIESTRSPGEDGRHGGGAPPAAHRQIAARLRALYAEAEREPLPRHLLDLLEQLDEAEAAEAERGASENPTKDTGSI
jgi:hypothetical protein